MLLGTSTIVCFIRPVQAGCAMFRSPDQALRVRSVRVRAEPSSCRDELGRQRQDTLTSSGSETHQRLDHSVFQAVYEPRVA